MFSGPGETEQQHLFICRWVHQEVGTGIKLCLLECPINPSVVELSRGLKWRPIPSLWYQSEWRPLLLTNHFYLRQRWSDVITLDPQNRFHTHIRNNTDCPWACKAPVEPEIIMNTYCKRSFLGTSTTEGGWGVELAAVYQCRCSAHIEWTAYGNRCSGGSPFNYEMISVPDLQHDFHHFSFFFYEIKVCRHYVSNTVYAHYGLLENKISHHGHQNAV